MAWYRAGGGGIPSSLKTGMNSVLNKKFGTSTTYAPAGWPDDVNLLGPLPEKTVSGAIASFSDGADDVPLKSASFGIVASGGGGTPSTPVPIVGKSSVTVYQTGKNLFNENWEVGGLNDTTGLPNSDTNKIRSKTFSIIKGGTTCYVSVPQPIRVLFYASDKSFISETANIRNNSFSVPSNCSLFKIRGTVDYGTTYNNDIMISYGSTATTYEAYKSKTPITVSLGQTVYGGTLAEDGTLTLTFVKLNLWELPCTRLETSVSGKYRFQLTTQDLSAPSTSVATTGICNVAQSISADYLYGAHDGIAVRNSTTIHMYDENYSSDTALNFKAHLEEIGAVAVLPLRTSAYTVITGLDEISINTYLGDNSIWADTGDISCTYRADIDLALGGGS